MLKSILVVDDIPEIALGIKKTLDQHFDVDVASNGLEVLDCFNKKVYVGLLIDVDLEGMNGLEIASQLRSKYKDLKILIFSATATSQDVRQKAIGIGAAFSEKPLDPDFILRVMSE